MKIAVLIDTWFPFVGGGQINTLEISNRIAAKNNLITIITRNNGSSNIKTSKNLQVVKLGKASKPQSQFSKTIFNFQAFKFIYNHDFDIIHAHAFLPGITARLLMVLKNIPAVFTVHGTSLGSDLNGKIETLIEKFILTQIRYSAEITVSRDLLKHPNINDRIYFIPNAVDINKFDKTKNITKKVNTLIFVGRLHPQKNLLNLVLAINVLKKEIPQIRLLIAGQGQLKKSLKKSIRENGLTKNVVLLGEITGDELVSYYKSSQAFILPSIYEGQSLALLEAWAAKLPVIATRSGDNTFLVKENINGFLIDSPSDPDKIALVIKKALLSRNLAKIGQNGYNFLKKNFSWQKSADETLNVYEEILKARS